MTASPPSTAPIVARVLGVGGIVGGLGLLAAFVIDIPPALNTVRIVLFGVGAIAIAVALYPPHAAVSRRLALAATVPLIVANGWSIAWILLAIGRERPFAGDFGLVGFWAGLSFWLADAWFGVMAMRLGVAWRWAALVLTVGSLLAILGIDRLELTSEANPTVFGPIALTGIALNGLAWILLGVNLLVLARRGSQTVGLVVASGDPG